MIRLAGWPACLADKEIAALAAAATFEGYEQKAGSKTGIYRMR